MKNSSKSHRWDSRTHYHHNDKLYLHSSKHDHHHIISPIRSTGEDANAEHRKILLTVKDKSPEKRGTGTRGSLPKIATVDQLLRRHLLPGSGKLNVVTTLETKKKEGIKVMVETHKPRRKSRRKLSRLNAPTASSSRRRQRRRSTMVIKLTKTIREFERANEKPEVISKALHKKPVKAKTEMFSLPVAEQSKNNTGDITEVAEKKVPSGQAGTIALPHKPKSTAQLQLNLKPRPRFLETAPSGLTAAAKQTDSEVRGRMIRKARLMRSRNKNQRCMTPGMDMTKSKIKQVFGKVRTVVALGKPWFSNGKRAMEEQKLYYSGKQAQLEFYEKLRQFTLDRNRTRTPPIDAKKAEEEDNLNANPVSQRRNLSVKASSLFSPRERFIAHCHTIAAVPESINVVRGNKQAADFSFRGTGDVAAWGNWKDIKHLNLSENRMSVRGVQLLLTRTGGDISELDVSGNALGPDVCNDLRRMLMDKSEGSKKALIENIFKETPKQPRPILGVRIDSNKTEEIPEPEPSTTTAIPKSIAKLYTCQLHALNLAKTGIGDFGVITLAQGLKVNKTLKRLNVSNNKISDLGARMLHQALVVSCTLEELDISWNSLCDCVVDFVGLLSMKCLNLSWNTLRCQDHSIAQNMAVELRSNNTILVLDISNTKLDAEDTRLIAEGLEYNHVLLEINCHGNQGHTETDALGFMYKPANNLDKDGIHLLQQSIDMGERNRIKWLSLPDPLARYVSVEGDPHKEHKAPTSQQNVLSIHKSKWISGGWEQISIRISYADIFIHQVKGMQADLDVTVHLICDNLKAFDMNYRRMKSAYKIKRVLPPGRQYICFKVRGPMGVYHVLSTEMPREKVPKAVMLQYPNADWAQYGDQEMNYIDVKPRLYADLVVTTAPIRPGKNWVPPPIEPEWSLEKSIFAPRKKNHELQTFLESDHFDERFEKDWELMEVTFDPNHVPIDEQRASHKHEKVDIVDPTVAELPCSEEELQRVKQTLKENYRTIRTVFRHFAGKYSKGRIDSSVNTLNHRGFTVLLQNCKIIQHTAKNDHSIGNFEMKVSDSMFTQMAQLLSPNGVILRFEFMKLLIFIAHDKFVVSHVASSLPNGLALLLQRHLEYKYGELEFVDDFRKNFLYTKKCDKILRKWQNVLGKLHRLYGRGHGGTTGGNRITIKEFVQLCQDAEDMSTRVKVKARANYGIHYENLQMEIGQTDMNMIFVKSPLDVLDQTQNLNYRSLSWVDFLEAVCRLARCQFKLDQAVEVERRASVARYLGKTDQADPVYIPEKPVQRWSLATFLESLRELIKDKLEPLSKHWSMGLTPVFGAGKHAAKAQITLER